MANYGDLKSDLGQELAATLEPAGDFKVTATHLPETRNLPLKTPLDEPAPLPNCELATSRRYRYNPRHRQSMDCAQLPRVLASLDANTRFLQL